MGARQRAVEVLALQPSRVDLVGLLPPSFRRQGHLQHIRQHELRLLAQQLTDASPAGRALLQPHDAPAWAGAALAVGQHPEQIAGRRGHAQHLLGGPAQVASADHAIFIVIIDGQQDTLTHGGLPQSWSLGT